MNKKEHQKRHKELHAALDELVADYSLHVKALPSETTVLQLMQ